MGEVKRLPYYSGVMVDLLDRSDGSIKRVMLYPATRVELQEWRGGGWVTQRIYVAKGEHEPTSEMPVCWTEGGSM